MRIFSKDYFDKRRDFCTFAHKFIINIKKNAKNIGSRT